MMKINSNSRDACLRICLEGMSEPPLNEDGIYIGNSRIYNVPFLFDPARMLNRNIAIIGMSGSGKSFLLKSMLLKSAVHKGSKIIIVDWNGEYRDLIRFMGGKAISPESIQKNTLANSDIISVDFSLIANGSRRDEICNSILNKIIRLMRESGISEKGAERIIVLDEAWRLIKSSEGVGALFREGRKYRFSVIAATQLLNDINSEIISNSASLFLFRMQNESDYRQLADSGAMPECMKERIQKLEIGSCFVSLAMKENGGMPTQFIIKKVSGMQIFNLNVRCGKMKTIVSRNGIEAALKGLDVDQATRETLSNWIFQAGNEIECRTVICNMAKLGIDREQIVCFLRAIGIKDKAIALSYDTAAGI